MRGGAPQYNTGRPYNPEEHNPGSYAHVRRFEPFDLANTHLSHVRPWDAERRPYIPNNSREFSALSARPKTSLQVSTKKYPANFEEYNKVRNNLKINIEREFNLVDKLRKLRQLKQVKDRADEEYKTLEKLRDVTMLKYDTDNEYYRARYFYKGNEINDTGKEKAENDLSVMLKNMKGMREKIEIKIAERDKANSEYKNANNKLNDVIKLAKEREAVLNKRHIKDENYLQSANNNLLVDEITASYSSGGYKSVKRVAKRPVNKVAKRPVNKVAKRPTKKPVKKPTTVRTKRPAKPSAKPAKPAKRPVRK